MKMTAPIKTGVLILVVVLLPVLQSGSYALDIKDNNKTQLSNKDWDAIEHCLEIIRQCQMDNGMIRMKGIGEPVWTVPYFSNFAAMSLLAANDLRPNPQDVRRVEKWLLWYADNQESNGTIFDQQGTISSYKSKGKRDADDSYAATFLMTVWRYRQAIKNKPSPKINHAAMKAFDVIKAVTKEDGLTIAKSDYPIKYLMDNIEVYWGLSEGALLFDTVGNKEEAEKAHKMATRIANKLGEYWSEKDQCFAYALNMKNEFSGGLEKPYPHGLAQLFALAHLSPVPIDLWLKVSKKFRPDNNNDNAIPVERWLMAAMNYAGNEEIEQLRQATRDTMLGFSVTNIYVHRPALAILALIDGRARFPEISTNKK
ncbi:MAG: hypothetical protein PHR77_22420 [Kiritimatiellae bacterium]|nr:hypothetical protein [Kiritimatiellia bacterium]MDD5521088.1 hypothetical protein [Kiritimatiellia bacterium]